MLILIFIILFSWAVLKGIQSGSSENASVYYEKPPIEYVIPIRRGVEKEENLLNFIDYIKEKEGKDLKGSS